ncbi:hypothetical protein [Flavobacterium sp. CAN_S2]|jgi:hypothetical protein|uniref:hypothetical protein n=1 Tax=Flavobacterium sp. CAN_S2 TaxID=2787726 RepID=UPI0018CB306A
MITLKKNIELCKKSFSFLITEFECKLEKIIENGNVFFDINYAGTNKVISISLETYENYLRVVIFDLENGKLSDYDDKAKTIHLNQLTKEYFPKISKNEITENSMFFKNISTETEIEKQIVKCAKELRLVLNFIK